MKDLQGKIRRLRNAQLNQVQQRVGFKLHTRLCIAFDGRLPALSTSSSDLQWLIEFGVDRRLARVAYARPYVAPVPQA